MKNNMNETMKFDGLSEKNKEIRKTLKIVYAALLEKGYNPIDQIIGYILSGDPTYITSYKDARELMRNINRDELLEEVLNFYIYKFD